MPPFPSFCLFVVWSDMGPQYLDKNVTHLYMAMGGPIYNEVVPKLALMSSDSLVGEHFVIWSDLGPRYQDKGVTDLQGYGWSDLQ